MLAVVDLVNTQSNPSPGANAFAPRGQTFDLPLNFGDGGTGASWAYWHTGFSTGWDGDSNGLSLRAAGYRDVRNRWRASKGSAPVGRFTRSFGDNATEGWHRSMPVGIEVSAGTTATVAAMFILGATSTAEARATASAVGAFVLGVAAIAQARATATTTGTLTAGVTGVAEARATANTTGTLALGLDAIAEARALSSVVATLVLGLVATADVGAAVERGVVLAVLTLRCLVEAGLTARPVDTTLTANAPAATVAQRTAITAPLSARVASDAARTSRTPDTTLTARPSTDGTLQFESDDPVA